MRVFVTGGSGFVGSAVVKELLCAGHTVLGLARSDEGAEQLKSQGADVLRGNIEDTEVLRQGASACDGVIHLAFIHDFSKFEASCATDRAAIAAMGSALAAAGGNRSLVVTSGTMILAAKGNVARERDRVDMGSPSIAPRGGSEAVCLGFAKQGVRASVVRLPPSTHGPGTSGFLSVLVKTAKDKGVSAYVGDGGNRWCAGHRDDAAKLYRLAMESAEPGSVFHAVGEEGVPVKDIATEIGKQLGLPVVSISPDKAKEHFGWFSFGAVADNPASSEETRARLGWAPTGRPIIQDVEATVAYLEKHRLEDSLKPGSH